MDMEARKEVCSVTNASWPSTCHLTAYILVLLGIRVCPVQRLFVMLHRKSRSKCEKSAYDREMIVVGLEGG